MQNRIKKLFQRYIFSENLSLEIRILNMICIAGIVAVSLAFLTRLAADHDTAALLVMLGILVVTVLFMAAVNHFRLYTSGIWILIIVICDILFPVAFFAMGGMSGNMPTFFVLSCTLIFFLTKGRTFIVLFSTHLAVILGCFFLSLVYPDLVTPLRGEYLFLNRCRPWSLPLFLLGWSLNFKG